MPLEFRETLTDMSLGIVDNVPPDQIPDNAVADALNMVFDKRQQLRTRPGCSVFNTHHNLIASTYNDFSAWSTFNTTITGSLSGAPDGSNTATSLEDASASALGSAFENYTSLVSVSTGDLCTYDLWVRVPTTPAASGYFPGLSVRLDGYGVTASFLPDGRADAEAPWAFRYVPDVTTNTPTSYGTLATVVDSTDPSYTWYHVYLQVNAPSTGIVNFEVFLHPALGEYQSVSGALATVVDPSINAGTNTIRVWGQRFYKGGVLPSTTTYTSTNAVEANNYLTDRVTSLFQHRNSDGTSAVYATSGTQLFEYDSTNRYFDDITGALALPDDTLWQWVTFNGEAIGVNRSDTTAAKANPVVIPTPGGTPAALTGSPPKARYIAVFNDRVWLVDEDEPWKVQCSKLGDHEDWTETSRVIGAKEFEIGGGQDNYDITGLHVHQGLLLVFKRHSIYAIVPGSPNTDISQYTVRKLTDELGCLSGYTIKTVLNDVIFLSADGLVSLSNLSQTGSYEASILSRNLAALRDFDRGQAENAVAVVCPVKSQYILSFRSNSSSKNDQTYVLDYTNFQASEPGFTRCDGAWAAQSFANVLDEDGAECVLMGGAAENGVALVWAKDGNGSTFTDGGREYSQIIITKAYAPGDVFVRKTFVRWGLYLQLLQNSLSMAAVLKSDLKTASTKLYTLEFSGQVVGGAQWDVAQWDVDEWATEGTVDVVFTHLPVVSTSTFSAVAQVMQATLTPTNGEGFVFRGLLFAGSYDDDKQLGQ